MLNNLAQRADLDTPLLRSAGPVGACVTPAGPKQVFVWVLLGLTLALMPLYLFPSGGLQAVDLPILVLMAFTLFTFTSAEWQLISLLFISSAIFLAWSILVNAYFFTVFYKTCFFKPSAQWIYSLVLFFSFIILFHRLLGDPRTIPFLHGGLLVALILIPFVKGHADPGYASRQTFSFNDPNQLADFAILGIATVLVLNYFYKTRAIPPSIALFQRITSVAIILLAHVYVILSASRAGLGCLVLLDLYIFWNLNRKAFIIAAFVLPVLFFSLKDSRLLVHQTTAEDAPKAFARLDADLLDIVIQRIAGRIDFSDKSMLFGIGKCSGSPGLREGYNSFVIEREAHNTLADIIYAYGLIGLLLFCLFGVFYLRTAISVYFHIPILLAFTPINISQNFIRFRMLWVFYALLFSLSMLHRTNRPRTSA